MLSFVFASWKQETMEESTELAGLRKERKLGEKLLVQSGDFKIAPGLPRAIHHFDKNKEKISACSCSVVQLLPCPPLLRVC